MQETRLVDGIGFDKAHSDQVFALAPHLREIDVEEMLLCFEDGHTPEEILYYSVESSDKAYSIYDGNGVIHGFWGHGLMESAVDRGPEGYVWLLSDDALFQRYPKAITRIARDVIFPELDTMYSCYGNAMLSTNRVHLAWLSACGFDCVGSDYRKGRKFSYMKRGRYL